MAYMYIVGKNKYLNGSTLFEVEESHNDGESTRESTSRLSISILCQIHNFSMEKVTTVPYFENDSDTIKI